MSAWLAAKDIKIKSGKPDVDAHINKYSIVV